MDFGTYIVDGGDVQLLLFGTPGQRRFWFMTDIMKGEVDAVVYVVDAEATHTHVEAGEAMRALLKDLRVPLVVAVNRCDDPIEAHLIARQLGALVSEAVVPCQLIHHESGREVVIEALVAVLDRQERAQRVPQPEPIVLVGRA
jgi:signal recognition particle receptor subunit beta